MQRAIFESGRLTSAGLAQNHRATIFNVDNSGILRVLTLQLVPDPTVLECGHRGHIPPPVMPHAATGDFNG
jgi:hypothetical protein